MISYYSVIRSCSKVHSARYAGMFYWNNDKEDFHYFFSWLNHYLVRTHTCSDRKCRWRSNYWYRALLLLMHGGGRGERHKKPCSIRQRLKAGSTLMVSWCYIHIKYPRSKYYEVHITIKNCSLLWYFVYIYVSRDILRHFPVYVNLG